MARLTPYAFLQEFDNNGDPLSGGKIYTYEAGTTTPKTTYTTAAGDVANANPVILDSAGRADIWLGSGSYKFILKTSADVTLKTMDNLAGDTANAFGSSVVTISGNLAITYAYRNNVIISTAAATLSLQPAATAEDGFYFVIKNTSSSSLVTIDPNSTELIDGASTATVRAGQSALVICNGTGWNTIFLDSLNIFADSITTSGATGVVLKNSAGTTVATFGASAGTVSTLAGNLSIAGTGTVVGSLNVAGNASAAGVLTLAEDTDNGTNKVTITPTQTIASDYTLTLPSAAGTLARVEDVPTYSSAISATTSLSGTTTDIALPANIKQFTLSVSVMSLNAIAQYSALLGTASSFETATYASTCTYATSAVATNTSSAAILLTTSGWAASANIYGSIVFTLLDASTNEWAWTGVLSDPTLSGSLLISGTKALSGALTRIRLTSLAGIATFDTGKANVVSMY